MTDSELFWEWRSQIQIVLIELCSDDTQFTKLTNVYLTQAIQSRENPVPLVAGNDALLRVFLTNDGPMEIRMPPVRAVFYQGDLAVHTSDIPGQDANVPRAINERSLESSANAMIPGWVVMPDLTVVIEIDPDKTLGPVIGIPRRIPEKGRISFDVRQLPPLEFTIVPMLWTEEPDLSILPDVLGLTPESDFLFNVRYLLPVGEFSLIVHPPFWSSHDTRSHNADLLHHEIAALHAIEGNRGYIMGIMTDVGPGSSVAGIAFGVPGQVSLSILNPKVVAHELGHSMSLLHAPCGGAGGPDPFFPNDNGSIGSTGFDIRTETTIPPNKPELMGYCGEGWISGYFFIKALNHRQNEASIFAGFNRNNMGSRKGLLVWGRLNASGELTLEPAFVVDAAPVYPWEDGPYSLEGQRENGDVLFTLSFAMLEYDHIEGGAFAFVLPVNEEWAGSLDRITLYGPEGAAEINADGDRFFALMRDPVTGEVRGILRDWHAPTSSVAGRRLPPEPGMEITVSSGIPDLDSW